MPTTTPATTHTRRPPTQPTASDARNQSKKHPCAVLVGHRSCVWDALLFNAFAWPRADPPRFWLARADRHSMKPYSTGKRCVYPALVVCRYLTRCGRQPRGAQTRNNWTCLTGGSPDAMPPWSAKTFHAVRQPRIWNSAAYATAAPSIKRKRRRPAALTRTPASLHSRPADFAAQQTNCAPGATRAIRG
ncbi:hypothetical protein B0H17DRAFT_1222553 [Mycena rosella]|uniref:Uncharacterized protein n=1 Tax=Mycena rosella TaxID=1033263 RepID=A0AAD7F7P8_MYCRO|nr:hypothetical protein B0H17DRAFT_1222553 [Mycena rosella]